MTLKINEWIPFEMNGPNPAKFANCILRSLFDSDASLLLQYGKVQATPYKIAFEMGLRYPNLSKLVHATKRLATGK